MARKLIVEIIGDSTSYQRALGKSEQASRRFGETTRRAGKQAFRMGAEVAAVGAVIGVVASREFSKFEDSMNKIIGLVGVSREQVHAWSDDLLEMSTVVAKSPTELADALFFITSAGFRGAKALDALNVAAHASAAGLGETKTVADAMTSAINAYGQANLTATQASDVLVATVREGKVEAAALAPVIGNVAAFASALGVSFDQVGAALAAQTRITGDAKSASVQLTNVFSTLAKGAPKTVKGFKAVGLDLDTVRETLAKPNGLLKALLLLKEHFGGNIKAAAQAFGNIRALRGVLALVGKSADQTEKIFAHMRDTTGSTARAFAAISEDEGFQFQRTLQALRVVGIRLGAILEPLANLIARGLTNAFKRVSSFLHEFEGARTLRAKLKVVWSGAEGIATAAERTLKRAMGAIDWGEVFASARGMADALQARLEDVDWSFVGKRIGDSIAAATKFIIPAAQDLGARLTKALVTIRWEQVGAAMGPGLVTAILSAFNAILDPAFWLRNWKLALAVGFNTLSLLFPEVFGLGKLLSIAARPFTRLGGELVARLTPGFIEGMNRLPGVLGRQLVRLGGFLLDSVTRLGKRIAARFNALRGITRFTIRVLGIAAAIGAVEQFVRRVIRFFRELPGTIKDIWNNLFSFIERRALRAAIKIIEPFTHLPRILGGGKFQDLKEQWQLTLTTMEVATDESVKNITDSINRIPNRVITVTVVEEPGEGRLGTGGRTEPTPKPPRVRRRTTPTPTTTPPHTGGDGETDAELAKKRAERLKKAAEKAQTAYDNLIASLELKFDMAVARRGFKDDLAALNTIRQAILDRIKVVGKTTELARQLFENTQQLAQVTADARKAAQFKELGLTPEGQKPTPGAGSLLHRALSLQNQIKGTVLDTNKTRSQLKRIINFLKGNLKTAGREVRQAVLDMLNDISSALSGGTSGTGFHTAATQANTKKLIEGLGLDKDQTRELRARLAKLTQGGGGTAGARVPRTSRPGPGGASFDVRAAGRGGINIYISGDIVTNNPEDFIKQVQKKANRHTATRRGTRPGKNRGMG